VETRGFSVGPKVRAVPPGTMPGPHTSYSSAVGVGPIQKGIMYVRLTVSAHLLAIICFSLDGCRGQNLEAFIQQTIAQGILGSALTRGDG
jgi:hypothetical protein